MSTTNVNVAKPLGQPSQKHSDSRSLTSNQSSYYSQTSSESEAYLRHDITTERELSLEDFAKSILGCDHWIDYLNSKTVREILEDEVIQDVLSDYNEAVKDEDEDGDRFGLFALLANHVLKQERAKKTDYIALKIDVDELSESDGVRMPQIVIAHRNATSSPGSEGSETRLIRWKQVLGYVDFRLEGDKDEWATAFGYSSTAALGSRSGNGVQSSGSARNSSSSRKRKRRSSEDEESSESSSKRRRGLGEKSGSAAKLRCAGYALDMLSTCGGVRTHALGFYIDGYNISLHYFDRSIFVSSSAFSTKEDPRVVVAIFLILRGLDDVGWGFMPGFKRRPPLSLTLGGGWEVEMASILSQQRVLIGRGTAVIRGRVVRAPNGGIGEGQVVVIKISNTPRTGRSERDILQLVYDKAVGEFGRMRDCLPEIYYCGDVELGVKSPQGRLSVFFDDTVYERRALRVIIFRELRPIQELVKVEELATVFRDVFNCYRWLYEEVKVLHRDISLNNVMYHRKDGKVCGVLNDFDHAAIVGDIDTSPAPRQQIGTTPFMSYELLTRSKIAHLYRHDLESLFYVILILTSHYENGKAIPRPPLRRWFKLEPSILGAYKFAALIMNELPSSTPSYAAFKKWLDPMAEMFRRGALTDRRLSEETLGGNITFDKMAAVFEIELCSTSDGDRELGCSSVCSLEEAA